MLELGTHLLLNTKGILIGLRHIQFSVDRIQMKGNATNVMVNRGFVEKILSFLSSNVSPENCGSSLISILYRDTNSVNATTLSSSANLGQWIL